MFQISPYELEKHRSVQTLRNFDDIIFATLSGIEVSMRKGRCPPHRGRGVELTVHSLSSFCHSYEPIKRCFVEKLMEYNGERVVINHWCHYITFDVIGDVAFNKSYCQLEDRRLHQGTKIIDQQLSLANLFVQVPWIMCIMQQLPVKSLEETEKVRREVPEAAVATDISIFTHEES